MKKLLLLCFIALSFELHGASKVSIFGVEFDLPDGCVLYPRPSLIDEEIRFECSTDKANQPALTIRFESPEHCAYKGNLHWRSISESSSQGVSISVRAYTVPPGASGEIYVATLQDHETCFSVMSHSLQAVQLAIEPVVSK